MAQGVTVSSVLSNAVVIASSNDAVRLEDLFFTHQQMLSSAVAAAHTREALRSALLAFALWNIGGPADIAVQSLRAGVSGLVMDPTLATLHCNALQLLSPGNDTNVVWVLVRSVLDAVDLRATPDRCKVDVIERMHALDVEFSQCVAVLRAIWGDEDEVCKRQRMRYEQVIGTASMPASPVTAHTDEHVHEQTTDSGIRPVDSRGSSSTASVVTDNQRDAPMRQPTHFEQMMTDCFRPVVSALDEQRRSYRPHITATIEKAYHAVLLDGRLVCHHHQCTRSFQLFNDAHLQSFVNRTVFEAFYWQTFLCDEHKLAPLNIPDREFCCNCMRCTDVTRREFKRGRLSVSLCAFCLALPNVDRQCNAMERRRPDRNRTGHKRSAGQ